MSSHFRNVIPVSRRKFIQLGAAALLTTPGSVLAARTFPVRPVRIVVGFATGGPNDISARLIAQWLSQRLGQQVIVENQAGAGGNIATETVIHAPADGYTLLLVPAPAAINATLYHNLPFNFIHDIAPVAGISACPRSYGRQSVSAGQDRCRVRCLRKSQSRQDQHGDGGQRHRAACRRRAVQVHDRRQSRDGGRPRWRPALVDLLAGHVQVMFEPTLSTLPHIKAGKLRALAVTSEKRAETLPDVPALNESVPGYEATAWFGIGAPKKVPGEIIDKLNNEINACLADATLKGKFVGLGGAPMPMSPREFGALIASETDKWAKVIKFAGIKMD